MNSYRYGALTVVEKAADTDQIQRSLKQLDPRLFLERQVTLDDQLVWVVMCDIGSDQPPLPVFEWRDPDTGAPIHVLSSGIVDRMARMERDPRILNERVRRQNEEFMRRRYEEISEELRGRMEEHRKRHHSQMIMPRSPGLVAARRRMRRQGHNI